MTAPPLLLFTCCLALASSIWSSTLNDTRGSTSTFLKFVATVDGKSYFADRTANRDWEASSIFCQTYGMRLATITSSGQWQALLNAKSADFSDYYWTAGRDAQKLRQFSWNESDTDASASNPAFFPNKVVTVPYLTCLAFTNAESETFLYPRQCSMDIGALCETL